MPCAAPCNRLPCSKRCSEVLPCGHQCPSLCGEICPIDYCQSCSSDSKRAQRIDLLEFKSFSEVDIDESPIVVLGCGHFFTAETLDGHMQMSEVYDQDLNGEFVRLRDDQGFLAKAVPQCPDCQQPVRQYATQRYNRVINRAVADEMSKRFLVIGKVQIEELELQVDRLAGELEKSQKELIAGITGQSLSPAATVETNLRLTSRHDRSLKLFRSVAAFLKQVDDKNQPARKLHDATVKAARATASIEEQMKQLSVEVSAEVPRDRRIVLGARSMRIKLLYIILADKVETVQEINSISAGMTTKIPGQDPIQLSTSFFKTCEVFIADCNTENLPKLNVAARLYYARAARLFQKYAASNQNSSTKATDYVATARAQLEEAKEMCTQPFQNAQILLLAVEQTLNSLRKEWYAPISASELSAIKDAMVAGPRGLATHSGHWYNCQNGHPVSPNMLPTVIF